MKAIWDAGEDISVSDLMATMKDQYGKEYARTTVATFLLRLSGKGYIDTYRNGKLSYAHAVITKEEYRKELAAKDVDFWFKGNTIDLLAALHESGKLSGENLKKARKYLSELEAQEKKQK